MENQVLQTISKRRSHRKYLPGQISPEQLDALVSAALQSPSAVNRQPWHFSVVQDRSLLERIAGAARKYALTLKEEERGPRFSDPSFDVFYHAPTVILISSPASGYSLIDCGIAVQTIALAAESLGLGSCIVALARFAFLGEDGPGLAQALQFPEGSEFRIALALGHPADDKADHGMDRRKVSLILGD
ncbi:MAG: nitroreductase family protein [Christensenellales bacterium]